MQPNKLAATLASVGLAVPSLAMATNGMVMEAYAFSKQSEVNFGLSYAPEVSVTGTGPNPPFGNGGMTIEHSQVNWQLMYSPRSDRLMAST